jgi:hypothetical protein
MTIKAGKRVSTLLGLSSLLLLSGTGTTARAEGRHGLSFGVAAGAGLVSSTTCLDQSCQSAKFGRWTLPNITVGYFVRPDLSLQLILAGGVHRERGRQRAFDALLFAARYWLVGPLWVIAGLGIGEELPPAYAKQGPVYLGSGAMGGLGIDVWKTEGFTIDLQARATVGRLGLGNEASRDDSALDALVGVTWY